MTQQVSIGGLVTGIGSWPGTDARESAATILGELGGFPHLVELPSRGLGADMVGRAGAILVDINLDASTRAYRVVPRRGKVAKRAEDFLNQDLDALEEAWESARLVGEDHVVKLQVAGPLTLGAEIEVANGSRVLVDRGALRDVAESLGEGLARHAAEVTRRTGAAVVIQLDEPQIAAVLAVRCLGAPRWRAFRHCRNPRHSPYSTRRSAVADCPQSSTVAAQTCRGIY